MNILLVEDSPTDTLLVQNSLAADISFRITSVTRLSEAVTHLQKNLVDVVLLDLGLPDSHGLDSIHGILPHCGPDTSVVVLTINNDRAQGALALRAGAVDYLFKNHISNPEALRRCIVYACDRRRQVSRVNSLERELALARKEERRNQESAFWSELSHGSSMEMASHPAGEHASLQDSPPTTLDSLVEQYGEILEASVNLHGSPASADVSGSCARLVARLGELHATPRDVIDLHVNAVRRKMESCHSLLRAQAYQEEGRLRVVEVMGFLAAHYRAIALDPGR